MLGPITSAGVMLALWAAVAHASGSEWVQALGTLVAGIVLVGVLGPWLALRRIELAVVESPRDSTSGEPCSLHLVASAACRCDPVRPGGRPLLVAAGRKAELVVTPEQRGVIGMVEIRVSSAAPLGLFWWSGCCRLQLPQQLTVSPAPQPGRSRVFDAGLRGDAAAELLRADDEAGELRGVREYRVGDSPRRVHWRSTAHTGELMVRESESRTDAPVRLVAELPDDDALAESRAGELLGTVQVWLDRRRRVVLETTESGRRVVAGVADAHEAGRRLARAGTNPWADLGPPDPADRLG